MLASLTRLFRVSLPCLVRSRGETDGDSTPTNEPLSHCTLGRERSHEVNVKGHSSESAVGHEAEYILITHLRATNLVVKLRRIPVGFYVAVNSDSMARQTSIRLASVRRDVIEWDDEIVLSPGQSSDITFTIFASFELGATLGNGEILAKFDTTIDQLFEYNGQLESISLSEQSNTEDSLCSFLDVKIDKRVCDRSGHTIISDPPQTEEMRRLVELTDKGHLALSNYRELGEEQDLDDSIRHFEHARDLCPLDHPSRAIVLFNLASAKLIYCRVDDEPPDFDTPVSLYRAALRLRPRSHPDHVPTLLCLGIALQACSQTRDAEADGKEGRALLLQVLDTAEEDSYAYLAAVLALGSAARGELIQQSEDSQSVESGFNDEDKVQRLDAALQQMFYFDSPKRAWLDHIGVVFCIQLNRLDDLADHDEAIPMLDVVLQFTTDSHPGKPSWLDNLGRWLLSRYNRFGDVADLEKSTLMSESAVRLTPDHHPDKPLWLNNLGVSLSTRYQRFGDVVELEKSISVFEEAIQLMPDDHPDRPMWLNNLGNSLCIRYSRFGDTVDLGKSISIREDALHLTPHDDPGRPLRLNNLGLSLLTRYNRFGDVADLEKSISMREDALWLTPDDHPSKPSLLNGLGISLWTRYLHFGDAVDLEKSISTREDAARLTPDGHPDKQRWLNNLGNSLSTRYLRFGDVVDLEKSVSMREDAMRLTPDDHPDKPLRLISLGNSLLSRYERFGDVTDLERSISIGEQAVQFTPDDHPSRPTWLNNFGNSLLTRYERFGDVADLEKSISMFQDALDSMPDDHPNKPRWLINLGNALSTRYDRFRDVIDLEKSISVTGDAVLLTPDSDPSKSSRLNNLALSHLHRFDHYADPSSPDLSKALSYSRDAARSGTSPSAHRFQATQTWTDCLRLLPYDPQPLLDAYSVAIDLLPRLAWIGLSLRDRYHQLVEAADMASGAAAAALKACKPELAIEWLEQGRSIVWSQHMQLRTPVDDLRVVHPELAAEFEHVSLQLEHTTARDTVAETDEVTGNTRGSLEKQAKHYHALALRREVLLAQIRALSGFERFLLPKTIDQLAPLAHSGPVVFLNASKYRCDALVVMTGSRRIVHVPLANTTYDEISGMQRRLGRLLKLDGRVIPREAAVVHVEGASADEVFESILPRLWSTVVKPVLDVLILSSPHHPRLPRIFWCPTGPFTFLPIHAAGYCGPANPGPSLPDVVISSYIPSMSALKLPEDPGSEATSGNFVRLLAVRQPSTDGAVPLRGVEREMETIRELVALAPFVDLQETDGTVEDVMANMKVSDWVHFACHGVQDRTDPLESGLLLAHRRRLTVSDMVRLTRPRGGLAFLSACSTATGDEQLSGEAVHIAAGMLLAGYRAVIATMWSIKDSDAPKVAGDLYTYLFQDGKVPDSGEAAEALHHAVRRLRNAGAPFLSWVPFIHVGL